MATRTAVVAGTATAVSGRVAHRQHERYQAQAQAEQAQLDAAAAQAVAAQAAAAPAPSAEDDQMAKLQSLAQLHQQGVLSDEEFAAAKAKILGI
jgi:hypothetical protein